MQTVQSISKKRLVLTLLLAALPGVLAMMPATVKMLPELPADGPPLAVVTALALLQSLLLVAISALAGAWAAPKVGFPLPSLTLAELAGRLRRHAGPAALIGVLAGMLAVGIEVALFRPYLPDQLYMLANRPAFAELVPSLLYGGIVEEILIRWGLMSLITWLFWRLFQGGRGEASAFPVWAGIAGAALLFGLAHLPVIQLLVGTPTTGILVRTLVQNGIPGLLFGWLFARRGLESAIIAHMGFHIGMFLLRFLFA